MRRRRSVLSEFVLPRSAIRSRCLRCRDRALKTSGTQVRRRSKRAPCSEPSHPHLIPLPSPPTRPQRRPWCCLLPGPLRARTRRRVRHDLPLQPTHEAGPIYSPTPSARRLQTSNTQGARGKRKLTSHPPPLHVPQPRILHLQPRDLGFQALLLHAHAIQRRAPDPHLRPQLRAVEGEPSVGGLQRRLFGSQTVSLRGELVRRVTEGYVLCP